MDRVGKGLLIIITAVIKHTHDPFLAFASRLSSYLASPRTVSLRTLTHLPVLPTSVSQTFASSITYTQPSTFHVGYNRVSSPSADETCHSLAPLTPLSRATRALSRGRGRVLQHMAGRRVCAPALASPLPRLRLCALVWPLAAGCLWLWGGFTSTPPAFHATPRGSAATRRPGVFATAVAETVREPLRSPRRLHTTKGGSMGRSRMEGGAGRERWWCGQHNACRAAEAHATLRRRERRGPCVWRAVPS